MKDSEYCKTITNKFNQKLSNWYDNAKRDYGVMGSGECKVLPDEVYPCGTQSYKIMVVYTEDGVETKCYFIFMPEWSGCEDITTYLFDIWAELGFEVLEK